MNPYHHALSSAAHFGGQPDDYLPLHQWLDESKAFFADFRHRALRHHAEGIFLLERLFGVTITNSDGRSIPVRFIGEQHVKEDCQGRIPSMADWLGRIQPEPWMANGHIDLQAREQVGDPRAEWLAAVAAGKTILGLKDWMSAQTWRSR